MPTRRCAPRSPGGIPSFSDRLKVIAEFALEHPTEMALGTVAEVASRAKVQPSAVVRFANALGYGGFSEIQQVFRSRLVASVAPTYKERIAGLRRDGRFRDANTPHSVLVRFTSEGLVSAREPAAGHQGEGLGPRHRHHRRRRDDLRAGPRRIVSGGRCI